MHNKQGLVVGSNLVEALKKDHTIYGLDIISPQKDGVRFTFSWDFLDKPGEIPEVDAIIHLAGKAHDTKNQSAAEVYFKVNTGLLVLSRTAARSPLSRTSTLP